MFSEKRRRNTKQVLLGGGDDCIFVVWLGLVGAAPSITTEKQSNYSIIQLAATIPELLYYPFENRRVSSDFVQHFIQPQYFYRTAAQ